MHAFINRRNALVGASVALLLPACSSSLVAERSESLPNGLVSDFADVDGARLHYVRGGDGPALILLHGFPETWAAYRAVMPRLATRFDVVAVDLPGIGLSGPAVGGYDGANTARYVGSLARSLQLNRPYVVGHDIGGLATYAYIRQFPDASRGAMIVDAPMPGLEGWHEATRDAWHPGFMQVPGLAEKLVPGRQQAFLDWFYDFGKFTAAQREAYAHAYGADQLHAAFQVYRALPRTGEWNANQVERNTVPLAVVVGEVLLTSITANVGARLS